MDDLNDLVWSSSSQSTQKPSPFASSFDLLAGSSSSSLYNLNRTASPQPPLVPKPSLKPPTPKSQTSTDAFANLFSLGGGPANGSARATPLSMAEKQAKLREQAAKEKEKATKGFESQGAFWDQLEGPTRASTSPAAISASSPPIQSQPLKALGTPSLVPSRTVPLQSSQPKPSSSLFPSTASSGPSPASNPKDIWSEFDLLSSSSNLKPTASSSSCHELPTPSLILTPPVGTQQPPDPFDFFETSFPVSEPSFDKKSGSRSQSPIAHTSADGEDWGFGDRVASPERQTGASERGNPEEEDFMSAFNTTPSDVPPANQTRPSRPAAPTRKSSPPPHIVGQLVEMGFTPSQARQALASTESGLDVQVAASMLLSESSSWPDERKAMEDGAPDENEGEEERLRREEELAAEKRRRRRQGPSRSSVSTSSSSAPSRTETPPNEGAVTPLQEQASKLLAQTNLLGASVLNRANVFWKEGKNQVQKAYEERTASTRASAGNSRTSTPVNGRPRWMTEQVQNDSWGGQDGEDVGQDGFRDDRLEGSSRAARREPREEPNAPKGALVEQVPSLLSAAAKIGNLFSTEELKSYVSPNRRRPAQRSASPQPPPSTPAASRPPATPSPKPLRRRTIPAASPQSVDSASSHRTKGNEFFKLGQFGEAETAYTQAIELLPTGHLRLLPLYNNRAAARLKNGDHSGSASDSSLVVSVVGLDYSPDKEVPLPSDVADLNLGEALVKAISKRASAMEMGEKWEKAKEDWDLVGKLEVAVPGAQKIAAMDGARRCKKMIDLMNGVSNPPPAPPSKPKPKPRPQPSATSLLSSALPASTGAASALLKANTATLESEELQRDQHKDAVDARILSWKAGKEANIRALIGSLENVLWPELGWPKVGLHELVTDKQVKIKYTRAIAKVHPDKLNAGNTTVEQRMIANGVFSALNEAWNAAQK